VRLTNARIIIIIIIHTYVQCKRNFYFRQQGPYKMTSITEKEKSKKIKIKSENKAKIKYNKSNIKTQLC